MNPTTFLSLNLDVLGDIISFLSTSDALRLSVTSKELLCPARHYALCTVSLSKPETFEAFCTFALEDVPNRLHCVQDLRIARGALRLQHRYISEQFYAVSAALLADILEHATSLRALAVPAFDPLFAMEPRIGGAVAALTSLQILEMHDIAAGGLRVLSELQSQPRRLVLRHATDRLYGDASLFASIAHLQRLESLELADFHGTSVDVSALESRPAQWPEVQRVVLTSCSVALAVLPRAFPHLQTLDLHDVRCPSTHQADSPSPTDPFALARVSASGRDMREWPASCPIHWLQLDQSIHPAAELHGASPTALSIMHWVCQSSHAYWEELVRAAAPSLRYLEIVLMASSAQLPAWMETVLPVLAKLSIVCFKLTVVNWDDGKHLPSSTPPVLSDDPANLSALAHAIANDLSVVRYIAVGLGARIARDLESPSSLTSFGYVSAPVWWAARGEGKTRSVERVSLDVGESIADSLTKQGTSVPR